MLPIVFDYRRFWLLRQMAPGGSEPGYADAAHVVHHAGKDGKDERGSSALRGAADLMVKTQRDGNSPRLTLACDKAKDFEPWDALTLERELVGSSCVLSLVEDAKARDELRDDVLAYVSEHGPVSQNAVEKAVAGRAVKVREALTSLDRNNRIRRTAKGWQEVRPDLRDAPGRTSSEAPDAECVPDGGKGTTSPPAGRTSCLRPANRVPTARTHPLARCPNPRTRRSPAESA
jgi:hypothetical protein